MQALYIELNFNNLITFLIKFRTFEEKKLKSSLILIQHRLDSWSHKFNEVNEPVIFFHLDKIFNDNFFFCDFHNKNFLNQTC